MPTVDLKGGLRAHYGPTIPIAAAKAIRHFDRHCRDFIAASPFCVLATGDGRDLDVSPKGGAPGFVEVEDESHLLMPDYAGNNRLDGLMNIAANPKVAMVFSSPAFRKRSGSMAPAGSSLTQKKSPILPCGTGAPRRRCGSRPKRSFCTAVPR